MNLRNSLTPFRASLWSALGLSPLVACGGVTATSDSNAGAGGITSTGGNRFPGGTQNFTGGAGLFPGNGGSGGLLTGGIPGSGGSGGLMTGGVRGSGGSGGLVTGGAGGTGGIRPGITECKNPTPYLLGRNNEPTGLVVCDGDPSTLHRAAQVDCPSSLPRTLACSVPGACRTDADCKDRPYGHCEVQISYCLCAYGCVRDSDCAAGEICLCESPTVGQCVPARCATDKDCSGLLCLTYFPTAPGCNGLALACQTPSDQCVSSNDCSPSSPCVVMAGGQRACLGTPCGAGGSGRPFLIDGTARLAPAVARSDWSSALTPCIEDLDAAVRAALAERWTEIGLMEHASIAANARFSLEMLSLGAPPDLVHGAYEAMGDEMAHARDAFALASAYAGTPVGPGALDVSRALAACSPSEIVQTAILEGCIGETVAAVEAFEALVTAEDEAVRAALGRIAVDETRHAELVWRFVQWVLEHGNPLLRQRTSIFLVELVHGERRRAVAPALQTDGTAGRLRSHGVLDAETRREIRRQVILEVVEPCARALVASVAPGSGERGVRVLPVA